MRIDMRASDGNRYESERTWIPRLRRSLFSDRVSKGDEREGEQGQTRNADARWERELTQASDDKKLDARLPLGLGSREETSCSLFFLCDCVESVF